MVIHIERNSLFHHGIKGQKWGVRRFENEDGTLTPAGRRRYNDDGDVGEVASKLSDQELRTRVNRLNMERQYTQLMSPPSRRKVGAARAREMLQTIGATLAVTATAATLYVQLKSGKSGAQQVSSIARTASKLAGDVGKVIV